MRTPPSKPDAPADAELDPHSDEQVQALMQQYGITREQVAEAVQAVGRRRGDLDEHLRNQGASAGAS